MAKCATLFFFLCHEAVTGWEDVGSRAVTSLTYARHIVASMHALPVNVREIGFFFL